MKIVAARSWVENLELTRPYTIAFHTFDSVENVFVLLQAEDGRMGIGSGAPAEVITGESIETCAKTLEDHLEDLVIGKDIRLLREHCRRMENVMTKTPAARAAIDIALHDLLAQYLHIPLVDMLGRAHSALPTSITIGIKSVEEALEEAEEYVGRGFRILKVKTGVSVEDDISIVRKLREKVGNHVGIRVDANQGYGTDDLRSFVRETETCEVEFIEQPFDADHTKDMLELPESIRRQCVADEAMHRTSDALELAVLPQSFGIFNIKLMKCGGITPAMQIAGIAQIADIELMWGCMDESIVSITAALHAAFASPATRYLDLDGSLDLARDLVQGGFILEDGYLRTVDKPGLGVTLQKNVKEKING